MKKIVFALSGGLVLWVFSIGGAVSDDVPNDNLTNNAQSSPPDLTDYSRPAIAADQPLLPSAILANVPMSVIDPVINNTDPNLKNTDTFGDGEPSIAINLSNTDHIVITAFSGSRWQPRDGPGSPVPGAALWYSIDGGNTFTKSFSIQVPPDYTLAGHIVGGATGCPCDQTIDYDRSGRVSGTFLTMGPTNVYSATATLPDLIWGWVFRVTNGSTQRTNQFAAANADQPWLVINRDPAIAVQDNIYVAYDDFGTAGVPLHVGVSSSAFPPNFALDNQDGARGGGFLNPGHRLATDRRSGWVYSLFQNCVDTPAGSCNLESSTKTIRYLLNRSQNGGVTWALNGNPGGIIVATGNSDQPNPKFGTVNALLGGVDHVAVDPATGDVYVVYGNRDAITGNNRLSIVRLTDNGAGGLTIGSSHFVTGQIQAALPSIAVADDAFGTVAVLYDSFDGIDVSGFPKFTAHLAMSTDKGVSFTDQSLLTFLSPAVDNGNTRQRVLGDYQQLKAVGKTFFGTFTGNGAALGRPISNMDPMFFKVSVP